MKKLRLILIAFFCVVACAGRIQGAPLPKKPEFPLVDIRTIDPSIIIDLRYAGPNNVAGRPLYPPGTAPLVRPEVARRLMKAQLFLRRYNYSLKIWDAYRPQSVQIQLWKAAAQNNYVAEDRKSTRLNSSHPSISYAVFCLK